MTDIVKTWLPPTRSMRALAGVIATLLSSITRLLVAVPRLTLPPGLTWKASTVTVSVPTVDGVVASVTLARSVSMVAPILPALSERLARLLPASVQR